MPRRNLVLAVAAAVVALGSALVTAPSAAAAAPGYVRLAHLSPDTPPVDVWLTSFRGGAYSKVFTGVGYGVLSPYRRVTPGRYVVAMRTPGSAKDSPPLLRATLTVASGKAYTVAGIGRSDNISLRVLTDQLSRPSGGRARMRVVQASSVAPVVGVATSNGTILTGAATFPSTTQYTEVLAGNLTIRATPQEPSVATVEKAVHVKPGRIYTVLVLDQDTTGIQLVVRADAASSSRTPAGSVDTGLGGMQTHHGSRLTTPMLALAVLLGVATIGYSVRRLRRPY